MTETDHWLQHFQRVHGNIRFRPLYWLGIIALQLGFLGLLWALPVPGELTEISPVLNWGSVFLMAALVYYFIISVPLAIGMLPVIVGITLFEVWLARQDSGLRSLTVILTVAGAGVLYLCHYARGGLRALRLDIQLLMIAPLWPLAVLYRKVGIPH